MLVSALGAWGILGVCLAGAVSMHGERGEQLSYVQQQDSNNWDIHLVELNRGLRVNLTRGFKHGAARNRLPAWSPDGETLAFVSDAQGSSEVYLYRPGDAAPQRLTDDDLFYAHIDWSPDGERLALGTTLTTPGGLRLADLNTGEVRTLAHDGWAVLRAAWSPDGSQIAYIVADQADRSRSVRVYDLATNEGRVLSTVQQTVNRIQWTPGGEHVTYLEWVGSQRAFWAVEAATGSVQFLQLDPFVGDTFAWEPRTGRAVVGRTSNSLSKLYFLDDATAALNEGVLAERLRLVSNNGAYDNFPTWSPNGHWLAYVSVPTLMGEPEIYIADVESRAVRRITANSVNDWSPAWRPSR